MPIVIKESYIQDSYTLFDCRIDHKLSNHQRKMQFPIRATQLKTMLMPWLRKT